MLRFLDKREPKGHLNKKKVVWGSPLFQKRAFELYAFEAIRFGILF
jgi:hypothetical protein